MPGYVDIDYVKFAGALLPSDVDALEGLYPELVASLSLSVSRMFDGRLHKRYATPFDPVPEIVKWHVAQVVAAALYAKRGPQPGSPLDEAITKAKAEALAWLTEAADSEKGLVELPTRDVGTDASAVSKGGPLGYTETSPYVWTTAQRAAASDDDRNGSGA